VKYATGEKTMVSELKIENLHVSVDGKEILKGINLDIKQGEIHALMGPNGSGKSTLSFAIMGHPKYEITKGNVILDGKNVLEMSVDERARAGLFLSFQYPSEIAGVTLANFLRTAYNETKNHGKTKKVNVLDFMKLLYLKMELLKMDKEFAKRNLNVGFSGGEKKRCEILQMAILEPKFGILDETDSGLDVDALRIVATGVKELIGPNLGVLIITHYQRILHYIKPDHVHIMMNGKIVKSGDYTLAEEIETKGYEIIKEVN
jgi:Fe-S cluster assembly ATP-binding protein